MNIGSAWSKESSINCIFGLCTNHNIVWPLNYLTFILITNEFKLSNIFHYWQSIWTRKCVNFIHYENRIIRIYWIEHSAIVNQFTVVVCVMCTSFEFKFPQTFQHYMQLFLYCVISKSNQTKFQRFERILILFNLTCSVLNLSHVRSVMSMNIFNNEIYKLALDAKIILEWKEIWKFKRIKNKQKPLVCYSPNPLIGTRQTNHN